MSVAPAEAEEVSLPPPPLSPTKGSSSEEWDGRVSGSEADIDEIQEDDRRRGRVLRDESWSSTEQTALSDVLQNALKAFPDANQIPRRRSSLLSDIWDHHQRLDVHVDHLQDAEKAGPSGRTGDDLKKRQYKESTPLLPLDSRGDVVLSPVTKADREFARMVFVSIGATSMILFSSMLTTLGTLDHDIYGEKKRYALWSHNLYAMTVVLTNTALAASLRVNRLLMYSVEALTLSLSLGLLTSVLFSLVGILSAFDLGDKFAFIRQPALGLTLVELSSIVTGVVIPQCFTMAGVMPEDFGMAAGFGQSAGAVATFFVSLVAASIGGPHFHVAVVFIFAVLSCVLSIVMLSKLSKRCSWVKETLAEIGKSSTLADERLAEEAVTPTAELFKVIWVQLFNIFFTFVATFCLFPSISIRIVYEYPARVARRLSIIMIGAFQFGDFIGRSFPALGLVINRNFLWIAVLLRLPLITLYRYIHYASGTQLWKYILIATQGALGISNGWCACCCFIHGPALLYLPSDREKANFFLAYYNVLGVLFGTLLLDLLTYGGYLP